MAEQSVEGSGGLLFRYAIQDWGHLPSALLAQRRGSGAAVISVAISTYRRLPLLVEAVQSVLHQRFDRDVEILMVDNDPASDGAQRLLELLPELRERNFRYFLNPENIGMFGNWNRCLQLARGEWLTILNDDDLLDANFLELVFAVIDASPSIDGLVCRKRYVDMRAPAPAAGPLPGRNSWRGRIGRLGGFLEGDYRSNFSDMGLADLLDYFRTEGWLQPLAIERRDD